MSKQLTQNSSRPPFRGTWLWVILGVGVGWLAMYSPLARQASKQVPDEPFRHVYVQSKIGSATKCLVTDRAGATARRSEPELSRARWKCRWIDGPDGPVLAALTGKKPSYLFIPEAAVVDPVLPLVYEAVRKAEQLPLPRVRWVQLFHDRRYRGLYLQLRLADKVWSTELELGRAELLETHGASAKCWNRKLEPACLLWNGAFIAESIFPQPAWSPGLALLHGLLADSGFEPRAFVLTELPRDEHHLWPLPLPVDLSRQLAPSRYDDTRYAEWSRPTTAPAAIPSLEVPEAEWARRALLEAAGQGVDAMAERLERSPSLAWLAGAEKAAGGQG